MTLAGAIATAEQLAEVEGEGQIVLVDHLHVAPEDARRFAATWSADVARLRTQPGFVSARLKPGADPSDAYLSIVVWESADALRASFGGHESPRRLRRPIPGTGPVFRFGSVEVDEQAREVRKNGRVVPLTRKEFDLLLTLVSVPRRVFTREDLMDRIWGYRAAFETGTLSVHMSRLRTKLEDEPGEPRHLQTVWGTGYRFVP